MARIELDAVTVNAAGNPARTILQVARLDLTEPRIAIIGANGSGKSTLARLVNGLVLPDHGTVRVDGLDTRSKGRAIRKSVGFLFTDPATQLVMPTAAEDVALSLRRQRLTKAQRREVAIAWLAKFGLDHHADVSVHHLSGGQRQLLALTSVLATDPTVLVADEPTTLLDLRNTRRVADTLFALPQQLVLLTHNLTLAARCDRILVMERGHVVFDGAPAAAVSHYEAIAA
ncbi:energy-coupling factor ABC transporter ATP-binding protein [Hoyosella sp. YIM 151337]|uniref:energy-coupling factor ABC transporter ATP-binding protein n=1 Tax=Hoyosella sp. YIM 151337 TaxID=2992742 RepID=UPI0022367A5C|nr:ABC transporter ATP-binding protein [Hoyosella sp. YIM 151337]MCW4351740.1 energy-coupling factor ABC transporter ATP-binding protein [Hoyosella sp. YIM 151337]